MSRSSTQPQAGGAAGSQGIPTRLSGQPAGANARTHAMARWWTRPRFGADLALSAVAGLGGVGLLIPLALGLKLARRHQSARRIAYFGTGRIDQVFPRNGLNLFLERECSDFDGYFEQMWNIHFPAGGRHSLDLTPRHHLVDFDLPLGRGSRGLRLTPLVLREVCFLAWALIFAWRRRVSLIEATNPYLQGLNAALVSRALGIPYAILITSDYDWFWSTLGQQAFPTLFPSRSAEKWVERWVLRHASLVIGDRDYYRQYAVRNGASPERAVATRVLADSAYGSVVGYQAGAARNERRSGPLLVYVGRLEPEKRPMGLVDCVAAVRRRFPGVRLVCAGTGSLAEAMRLRAAELGVTESLELPGNLPVEALAALVASADVVVAGHMGYTLVEAGMVGVPIATYDYDWHGEILDDGVTGFLVPLEEPTALADRVCSVLADPGLSAAMGARVRRRLLEEHSRAAVVPMYQAAYRRLLEGSRDRGPADQPTPRRRPVEVT